MNNNGFRIKEKLVAKYLEKNTKENISQRTDINVLLNRVKINQKKEYLKKLYFSIVASTGLLVFGLIIF
tara:strand:- start:113 stop:319 length:207 start_codon:yes stop_codon:yes gene_type:complete